METYDGDRRLPPQAGERDGQAKRGNAGEERVEVGVKFGAGEVGAEAVADDLCDAGLEFASALGRGRRALDLLGLVLGGVSVLALVWGVVRAAADGWGDRAVAGSSAAFTLPVGTPLPPRSPPTIAER